MYKRINNQIARRNVTAVRKIIGGVGSNLNKNIIKPLSDKISEFKMSDLQNMSLPNFNNMFPKQYNAEPKYIENNAGFNENNAGFNEKGGFFGFENNEFVIILIALVLLIFVIQFSGFGNEYKEQY